MVLEVWNDRFPNEPNLAWSPSQQGMAPDRVLPAEFMGWAELTLPLGPEKTHRKETLELKEDADTVERRITGTVVIEINWEPEPQADSKVEVIASNSQEDSFEIIVGTLTVTLLSADRLINLNLSSQTSCSNPYCTVICYPRPPQVAGEPLFPCIWRSPTQTGTLHPKWNVPQQFKFEWTKARASFFEPVTQHKSEETEDDVSPDRAVKPVSPGSPLQSSFVGDGDAEFKIDNAVSMLEGLLKEVRKEVHTLSDRVDRISG